MLCSKVALLRVKEVVTLIAHSHFLLLFAALYCHPVAGTGLAHQPPTPAAVVTPVELEREGNTKGIINRNKPQASAYATLLYL